jgi:hypothetical protein
LRKPSHRTTDQHRGWSPAETVSTTNWTKDNAMIVSRVNDSTFYTMKLDRSLFSWRFVKR